MKDNCNKKQVCAYAHSDSEKRNIYDEMTDETFLKAKKYL
jgi:hypothetical protein